MGAVWPDEMIRREKGNLFRTGAAGAAFYLAPVVAVTVLKGASPWEMAHFHIAIPIVLICLLPVAYLVMPLVDGVLVLGSVRPTTPRAALFVRCFIADAIAVLAFYLFVHSGELLWPAVYWALGLPAAFGVLRRIGAYQAAMERIATGETAE
jgi:hypothetical protein